MTTDIRHNSEKIVGYYKKTKLASKFITDCTDIFEITNLYVIYFKLLKRMSHYNDQIIECNGGEANLQLKAEIDQWQSSAKSKYKKIQKWLAIHERYTHEEFTLTEKMNALKARHAMVMAEKTKFLKTHVLQLNALIIEDIIEIMKCIQFNHESMGDLEKSQSIYKYIKQLSNSNIRCDMHEHAFDKILLEINGDMANENITKINNSIEQRTNMFKNFNNSDTLQALLDKQASYKDKLSVNLSKQQKHARVLKTLM
jgi:hypothetical protein